MTHWTKVEEISEEKLTWETKPMNFYEFTQMIHRFKLPENLESYDQNMLHVIELGAIGPMVYTITQKGESKWKNLS